MKIKNRPPSAHKKTNSLWVTHGIFSINIVILVVKVCRRSNILLRSKIQYRWTSRILSSAKAQSSKASGSRPSMQRIYATSISPHLPEQRAWAERGGIKTGMPGWGIRMILKQWAKWQHTVIILIILNLKLEKFLSGKRKIFHRHDKRIWWLL